MTAIALLLAVALASGCSRSSPTDPVTSGVPDAKQIVKLRETYDVATAAPATAGMPIMPPPTLLIRESTVGEAAADALARIGTQAVPALIEALHDPKPRVRELAALALARMGPEAESSVPELIVALQDTDLEVQRSAARALGQIGPEANQAIPALLDSIRHEAEVGVPSHAP
jgi:HEAT repeat protein